MTVDQAEAKARERALEQNTRALTDTPDPLYALARHVAEQDQRIDRLERSICAECHRALGDVDPHLPDTSGPVHPDCCPCALPDQEGAA